MSVSMVDRFNIKWVADEETGCWVWTSTRSRKGYGRFRSSGRQVQAHRFAYELHVGSIPEGLQLDHLCRNTSCVNPEHLEPVTNKENTLRGGNRAAVNARKTHCDRGHPLEGDNLRVSSSGRRICKACRNAINKADKAEKARLLAAGLIERPHGTLSTYINYGCRCVPCTEASATYARERYRKLHGLEEA